MGKKRTRQVHRKAKKARQTDERRPPGNWERILTPRTEVLGAPPKEGVR